MMKKVLLAFVMACLAFSLAPSWAGAKVRVENGAYVVDDAQGTAQVQNGKKAAARESAKQSACQDALVKVLKTCVPDTDKEKYNELQEKVFSKASSLVKGFKATKESVDKDGKMTLTGVCRIGESALDSLIGADVVAMLGNPRVMILIDEVVGDKAPAISTVEAEVSRIFEDAGYLIVDPDQAKALLHLSADAAFNDPSKLSEAARTLRADIIVVGKAIAGAFAKQKIHGITLYGVSGTVQLKAVLTQTAYQISSKTISQSTGKTPAQTLGGGADRCFRGAVPQATRQILYKIAYSMASAGSSMMGINIRLADASFQDVEAIEGILRGLAGASVFERSYRDNILEVDLVSGQNAREVASFLAGQGIAIESLTPQTLSGRFVRAMPISNDALPMPQDTVLSVRISDVASFEKAGEIEDLLREVVGQGGTVTGKFQEQALELSVRYTSPSKGIKTTREIASALAEKGIIINGVSQDSVSGKIEEKEKQKGLLW